MDIARIIQAICSGKSRKEVYNLLSPEEKDKLNSLASNLTTNRENLGKYAEEYTRGRKNKNLI